MSPAVQIFSRDFDADFFKLPPAVQARIEGSIDRLGMTLDSHSHHAMNGVDAYRLRVGDYRVIYEFDRAKGLLHLLDVDIGGKYIGNSPRPRNGVPCWNCTSLYRSAGGRLSCSANGTSK